MAKDKKKVFVFNDPTQKNSYDFYVLTAGIALQRFNGNPIMLDDHKMSNHTVLGRWLNVRVDNGLLVAEPEFDVAKESVKDIAGQVERDFIKACSMGFFFDPSDLQLIDGKLVLTKCELYECSIVPVPSNANSVALYVKDENGNAKLMNEQEVQKLCLSITNPSETNTRNDMNKIVLSAAAFVALGMQSTTEGVDAEAVNARVLALSAENEKNKTALQEYKNAEETAKLSAVQTKVDTAFDCGQIDATEKAEYVKLGVLNPDLLDSTLAKLPKKQSLSGKIENPTEDPTEVKTKEDFLNLSHEAQLSFKNENNAKYLELFTAKN